MMKVQFLTKEDRVRLPALYAQDGGKTEDHVCYVKFFNPYGAGTWLAMEFDGSDQFFGAVDLGHGWELGYFSLAELMSVKAVIGGREFPFQGIERDRHFKPMKYSEVVAA
jgi:hypothetical protein